MWNEKELLDQGYQPEQVQRMMSLQIVPAPLPPVTTPSFSAPPEVPASPTKPAANNTDVRKWARKKGIKISDRGKIPASVMSDYMKANGK